MKAYNIGDLKNNPSSAIKDAKDGPVLILNREHPEAVIFSLDFVDKKLNLNRSLAMKLYKDSAVSLGKAAKISGLSYSDFITLLGNHGIPIIQYGIEEVKKDLETLNKWHKKKR